jgi:hypothetical protein
MKFKLQHFGAEQEVELSWLWGIANAAELVRIATLQVGESVTLQRNGAQPRPGEPFQVTRVS